MKRSPRIGIALGSGSARGWAHIGVLRALAREGIEPQIISGCSIGAFVGAVAAAGDLDKLGFWVETLGWQDVVGLMDMGLRGGLIKGYGVDHQAVVEGLGCKALRVTDPANIRAALREAQTMARQYSVPVVVEVILEKVTNIAMGTEINAINELPC